MHRTHPNEPRVLRCSASAPALQTAAVRPRSSTGHNLLTTQGGGQSLWGRHEVASGSCFVEGDRCDSDFDDASVLSPEGGAGDKIKPISIERRSAVRAEASVSTVFPSTDSSRPGSRRFSPDELNCFHRVTTPSQQCGEKAEGYFQSTGLHRFEATERGLAGLPVLKGKFYFPPASDQMKRNASGAWTPQAERNRQRRDDRKMLQQCSRERKLSNEDLTNAILDEIYPKDPRKPKHGLISLCDDVLFEGGNSGGEGAQKRIIKYGRVSTSNKSAKGKRLSHTATSPTSLLGVRPTVVELASGYKDIRGHGNYEQGLSVKANPSDYASRWSFNAEGNFIMLAFRHRLLEKYSCINEGCACFHEEVPQDRGMTKKEWRRVLTKQGFDLTNKEQDMIFEDLDFMNTGYVSMSDFHIAVEAAAPVRTMEDLRRRWLASGYHSMLAAVRHAEQKADIDMDARIGYEEFCRALTKVNVHDVSEHQAIYSAICEGNKASLVDLQAAIGTVSPDLLLEDLRARLISRYHSMEQAYHEIDSERYGFIRRHIFLDKAVYRFGLTHQEAKKTYGQLDLDGNGEITKEELLTAFRLAEPSLLLEDLRLKIRRSYRSILNSLNKIFLDPLTEEINTTKKVTLPGFAEALQTADFKESESRMLFDLIETEKTGLINVANILIGIHHFAPACALEDLRARVLQRASGLYEAFSGFDVAQKSKLLNLHQFSKEMSDLGLVETRELHIALTTEKAKNGGMDKESSEKAPSIVEILFSGSVHLGNVFNVLDVYNNGLISLSRVLAALNCCGAGPHIKLPPRERDAHASREMKEQVWPLRRYAAELRSQVRNGLQFEEKSKLGRGPSSLCEESGGDDSGRPCDAPLSSIGNAPRLRTVPIVELANYMDAETFSMVRQGPDPKKPSQWRTQGAQESWSVVWDTLKCTTAPDDTSRSRLEAGLYDYFQSAALSMSHDVPLLSSISESSMDRYRKMRVHKAALKMP